MTISDLELEVDGVAVPWRLFADTSWDQTWCVLWLQGYWTAQDNHREGVERMARQSNTAFATLDFGGHGRHPHELDDVTRKQQLAEVAAVFDELQRRGFEHVLVIGGSFGGYLAALLTAKRPVAALVLRAPAVFKDEEFELPYRQTQAGAFRRGEAERDTAWRAALNAQTPSQALAAVKAFDGPVYVMEHELDSVIPRNLPRAYFELAKRGSYILIAHTEHSPKMNKSPQAHFDYIERWTGTIIASVRSEDELKPS